MSSELVVMCFPGADTADEVLKVTRDLEAAHLLRLDDAITVSRSEDGTLSVRRGRSRRLKNTALGMAVGALLGKIFDAPLLGVGLGAVAGAMADRVPETEIDERFVRSLAHHLSPNSSAAFTLFRRQCPDRVLTAPEKVLAELGPFGGTVLHTTLSTEDEERLQAAIDEIHRKTVALDSTTLGGRHRPRKPQTKVAPHVSHPF